MKAIATDKSQSQRLIACGVDPKTADLVWTHFESDGEKYEKLDVMDEYAYEAACLDPVPALSLSVLLSFLPTPIFTENRKQFAMAIKRNKSVWFVSYENTHEILFQSHSDNPIGAVVRAIEELTAHGHQLNEVNFTKNKNNQQ